MNKNSDSEFKSGARKEGNATAFPIPMCVPPVRPLPEESLAAFFICRSQSSQHTKAERGKGGAQAEEAPVCQRVHHARRHHVIRSEEGQRHVAPHRRSLQQDGPVQQHASHYRG